MGRWACMEAPVEVHGQQACAPNPRPADLKPYAYSPPNEEYAYHPLGHTAVVEQFARNPWLALQVRARRRK